ncbi:MAG: nucleotide sugar dehydrogenase [Lysobacterales bacterium]
MSDAAQDGPAAELRPLDRSTVAVIGMGYVGLPLAVALAEHFDVIGFDIDRGRVEELAAGHDRTQEVDRPALQSVVGRLRFSDAAEALADAHIYIVAVPTPVTPQRLPDLSPLRSASRLIGGALRRGDIVIYESTVYPGCTEEDCVPELEGASGLRYNHDFYCGYSPERINPGDKARPLGEIVKITSGSTPVVAEHVDALYRRIIRAGTHKAPSIAVAEAAKAVENTQRDVNIALANELALIFKRLGIDTEAVLAAAGTKWNFMPVRPGLVGGHCIGVDPYYLIHKAEEAGHYPELIRASRRINDGMSAHVSGEMVKLMALKGLAIVGSRILVLGLAFKEDCPDLRNTRVVEVVRDLRRFHAEVDVHDPWVDASEAQHEYGVTLCSTPEIGQYDAILIAVAHREFRELGPAGLRAWLKPNGVIYDLKYALPMGEAEARL